MAAATVPAILAVLAALCTALQVVLVEHGMKQGETDRSSSAAATLVTIAVSVCVFVLALLVRGTTATIPDLPAAAPFLLVGALNPVAVRLLYYRGIDEVGGSIAVILFSMYPAAAAIMAVLVLGETLSVGVVVGIIGIITGIAVLQTATDSGDADGHDDLLSARLASIRPREALYPVAAMLLVAVSWVLVKLGLDQFPHPFVATAVAQVAALIVALALFGASAELRLQLRSPNRRGYAAFSVAGIVVAVAWLAQFTALRTGTVVTVLPLLDTVPLFVVGFSYLAARQFPRSPKVLLAILLIIGGTALVQVL